ncbi:MAG: N-acetyl-gamma-glutamyl-phosphate reductase [Candidatus Omnitrophota bacterium]|nr:N-acetyl-gamma-glutamyl-phosphate reductase [Candidatus Omnitrophota bacterium]MBU2528234.1 N-acetyl-gamma-glutamyl-phosphate reductase [bacterium]MBU3929612.1 N-acetyl-gamma-glutamyl-phosphate reductase [bacterium]MBU4122207.1 N-acetyl-gamma-glutamyl-phosphate reductase [bacterium]
MIRVSIAGVTGFTGEELLKILLRHPEVSVKHLISRTPGLKISDIQKTCRCDLETSKLTAAVIDDSDAVFLCLPHTEAAPTAMRFYEKGKTVIDLSADFRLKNALVYRKTYDAVHPFPGLLSKAVYGLCEFNREKIKGARLIANPGCYPTATLLGVIPALRERLAEEKNIIVDAKSGISGAGKKLAEEYLYYNANASCRAYKVACHRHQSEIEEEILLLAGKEAGLTFVPHLIPQDRGMIVTIYMRMKTPLRPETVVSAYKKFYKGEKFVTVLPAGEQPATKDVTGTNNARIGIAVDAKAGILIVTSVIDNLVKGASGQAVQNMNIAFGFDEETVL